MGVELDISRSHAFISQFPPLMDRHPSELIPISGFPPSPSLRVSAMVQTASNKSNTNGIPSLKDIMQLASLSPPTVSVPATDIIYKTNTNGLWLEFPGRPGKPMNCKFQECRDEIDVLNSRLAENPGIGRAVRYFRARREAKEGRFPGLMDDQIPRFISFDRNGIDMDPEGMNGDESLFSYDDESDSDNWSFVTNPDASYESFDDVSILTEDTFEFEESKKHKVKLALVDSALTDFLVDFCSAAACEE